LVMTAIGAAAGDFGGGVRIGDDDRRRRPPREIGRGQVALAGQGLVATMASSRPRMAVIFERAGLQVIAGLFGIVCHSVPCPSRSGRL
jgi:hypothetical protein